MIEWERASVTSISLERGWDYCITEECILQRNFNWAQAWYSGRFFFFFKSVRIDKPSG